MQRQSIKTATDTDDSLAKGRLNRRNVYQRFVSIDLSKTNGKVTGQKLKQTQRYSQMDEAENNTTLQSMMNTKEAASPVNLEEVLSNGTRQVDDLINGGVS